ncbi:MAG: T9SS C-terminal target domain-containing protein, partial [Bacteroidia bacterium]|nr:T9SS C-terminal target domain-containing protein [Bacteroidia bacterium]
MKLSTLVLSTALLSGVAMAQVPIDTLEGNLTTRTLTSNKIYILKGFVTVPPGSELTIQPGTIIKGDKATKGALIIQRGAKIWAVGTATTPIVFTSNQPAGSRNRGDWSGLVICGNAPVNLPGGSGEYEGGALPGATFGGTNPNDNSGKLRYVRIEYAGYAINTNQEINGLTLAGVGNATVIDHVQVSFANDDSFEFFGGTVNAKHLVAYSGLDDDFDTDNGHSGRIQFAVVLRDPNVADAAGASNGFESDNDGQGNDVQPYTSTVFSNISVFGPKATETTQISTFYKNALHLRRRTAVKVFNSIFAGYPTGLFIDGSSTESNASNGLLEFKNNIIAGCSQNLKTGSGSTFDISAWFNTTGFSNTTYATNAEVGVQDPFNLSNPNFLLTSNSPALTGASFNATALQNSFFTQVSYRGAFNNTDNWLSGWTNFNPQNTNYDVLSSNEDLLNRALQISTAYPNPTTDLSTIRLEVSEMLDLVVDVRDLNGKVVTTLHQGNLAPGVHEFTWNTETVSGGL